MNSPSIVWLYSIAALIQFGLYVGALIYLAAKRRVHPPAANIAMFGVGLLLCLTLFSTFVPALLGSMMDTGTFVIAQGFIQIGLSLARIFAFSMILAAIFVGRQAPSESPADHEQILRSPPDDNPYVPTLTS